MKKLLLTTGLSALALALVAPFALAEGPSPDSRRGEGHRDRGSRMAERLGLSEAQADQLKTLRASQRATVRGLRTQVRSGHEEITTLLQSGADRATLVAKVQELSDLKTELMIQRLDFMLSAKQILTAEQFAQFSERFGKRGPRGRRFHAHGRRGKRGEFRRGDGPNFGADAQDD